MVYDFKRISLNNFDESMQKMQKQNQYVHDCKIENMEGKDWWA